jgi:hypothetical protein
MHGRRRFIGVLAAALVLAAGCTTAPTPPTRPADYLKDFCGFAAPSATVSGRGPFRLTGPHFDLSFTGSQVLTYDDELYRPAPGHEFLCVSGWTGELGIGSYKMENDDKVSARIVIDGALRPLKDLPTGGLMLSVPTGHPVALQVTDDGRTQSLDLRTGERGQDAIAGYYRPHDLQVSAADYDATARVTYHGTQLDVRAQLNLSGLGGSVEPWLPSRGWAPAGTAWLVLTGLRVSSGTSLIAKKVTAANVWGLFASYWLDQRRSFTVTPAGGHPIGPEEIDPPGIHAYDMIGLDLTPEFSVSDTFAGADLLFHPTGQIYPRQGNWPAGGPGVPVTWSQPLPSRTVKLQLH